MGGVAQGNAAHYQAQVARNNATIATQNAAYAAQAGQAQSEASSLKGAAAMGRLKAGMAASGVDMNSGSNVDVQESEAEANKLSTENTEHNALMQAYGYQTQATSDTAQSKLDDSAGDYAPIGAGISAAGGLLGNASSLGFKWAGVSGGNGGASPAAWPQSLDTNQVG